MQSLILVNPEVALSEAIGNKNFNFSPRNLEIARWLSRYLLNIPSKKTGGSMLKTCLAAAAESAAANPTTFAADLLAPIAELGDIVIFEKRIWDLFSLPLYELYRQGTSIIDIAMAHEIEEDHGEILVCVLINKALEFGEIERQDANENLLSHLLKVDKISFEIA